MSMTSTERVITRVRFSAELCGYHELKNGNLPELQKAFGDSLLNFFKGRVPVGNKTPFIGINARNSRDKELGTAVVGDILVFLGVEGEDVERACNAYLADEQTKKKYPQVWWEVITEETERRRAEEKQRRKEYSAKLMAEKGQSVTDPKKRQRPVAAASPALSVPEDDGTDPNDAF